MLHAINASVCRPPGVRARGPLPMIDLYRKKGSSGIRVGISTGLIGVQVKTAEVEVDGLAEPLTAPKARGLLFEAISEFPKGRKYLISLSFRGKASVRPAQVGGFDVNIVIHGSTAVRGRGDLVAYRWALWKLTAPWTHRTRPPHLGKRCAFSTSSTGPFPSNHSRKTPKGPKIALGNPDRPLFEPLDA